MPIIFDGKFKTDKKVSPISGKMFNKLQRAYIEQFSTTEIAEYYKGLDEGKVGAFPKDIAENLL